MTDQITLPDDFIQWTNSKLEDGEIYKVGVPRGGPAVSHGLERVNWPVGDRAWTDVDVKGIKKYMFYTSKGGNSTHALGFITTGGSGDYMFKVGLGSLPSSRQTQGPYKITITGPGPHYIRMNSGGNDQPIIISVEYK